MPTLVTPASTQATPLGETAAPPSQGRAVRTIPAKPKAMPRPMSGFGLSEGRKAMAVRKVTIGIAPPKSPATEEGRSAVPATKP